MNLLEIQNRAQAATTASTTAAAIAEIRAEAIRQLNGHPSEAAAALKASAERIKARRGQ